MYISHILYHPALKGTLVELYKITYIGYTHPYIKNHGPVKNILAFNLYLDKRAVTKVDGLNEHASNITCCKVCRETPREA
jgi:hypothetical protein